MDIKKKLTLLHLLAMSFLLLLGLYGALSYKSSMAKIQHAYEFYGNQETRALQVQVHFKKQVQEWKNILLRGTESALYNKYYSQFIDEEKETRSGIVSLLQDLEISSEAYHKAQAFLVSHNELGERYREALTAFKVSELNTHITVDMYVRGIDRKPTDMLDELVAIIQQHKSLMLAEIYDDVAESTVFLLLKLSFTALLIGILFVRFVNHKIVMPITMSTKVAIQVASGSFTGKIVYGKSDDETDRLLQALHTMQKKLSDTALILAKRNRKLHQALEDARFADDRKSEFLRNLSHELFTPMNGIMGGLELMRDCGLSIEQSEYLGIATDSSKNLQENLKRITDLSNITSNRFCLELSVFQTFDLLQQIAIESARQAELKGLKFTPSFSENIATAMLGDKQRIYEVLMCLIGNAIKFTSQGEVALTASIQAEDEKMVILLFEVKDSGIGIPFDKLDLIFDDFSQEDGSVTRPYEGLGIGLSFCRKILGYMGGANKCRLHSGRG